MYWVIKTWFYIISEHTKVVKYSKKREFFDRIKYIYLGPYLGPVGRQKVLWEAEKWRKSHFFKDFKPKIGLKVCLRLSFNQNNWGVQFQMNIWDPNWDPVPLRVSKVKFFLQFSFEG